MSWVTIKKTHVNADNLDAFRWENGELVVFFNGDNTAQKWDDPNRELYRYLCRRLTVCPVTEDTEEEDADG